VETLNTRPNAARSQVRCGHDVNNWCKLIADWLKLAELYKLVAEWLCVNIRYDHGTFAIAIYLLRIYKNIGYDWNKSMQKSCLNCRFKVFFLILCLRTSLCMVPVFIF
jgi:hypothetical protein